MSASRTSPQDFAKASQHLTAFAGQMGSDLAALRHSSSEMAESCRKRVQQTWLEWPERRANLIALLEQLPKELRKHDFVRNTRVELDRFEHQAKAFMAVAGQSFNDSLSHHPQFDSYRDSFATRFSIMQEHVSLLSARMTEMLDHPLTQKFLRGERVLSDRAHIQWARKFGHMMNGLTFLYLFEFSGIDRSIIWLLTFIFTTLCLALETARHFVPSVNDWVCRVFRPVMREREKDKVNSAIFFILAMIFVYLVFPRDIAVLSMLFISIADPVAGIVGVYFGKRKLSEHSSLEGSLACFVTCFILAFLSAVFLFNTNQMTPLSAFAFAIPAGLIGAAAEGSLKNLDDNLVMPLLSAPSLWLLLNCF